MCPKAERAPAEHKFQTRSRVSSHRKRDLMPKNEPSDSRLPELPKSKTVVIIDSAGRALRQSKRNILIYKTERSGKKGELLL